MSYTELTPEEFKRGFEQDEQAIIIDVRTPGEMIEGQIHGHILIDVTNPAAIEQINALDKSKPYYIYCRSGNRSAQTCMYMVSMGFEKTYNLDGGILAWNMTF